MQPSSSASRRWRLALLAVGCSTAPGCSPTRESELRGHLKSAALYDATLVDKAFRLAVCGWIPAPGQTFEVQSQTSKLVGDHQNGTGEVTATFLASPKAAYRCEGSVAFDYEFHTDKKYPDYYALSHIRRIGAPATIVADVERHAKPLALDTPATAFDGDWKLPDGATGAAYEIEVTNRGPYTVTYAKKYPAYEGPRVVAYQDELPVIEGSEGGALGFWQLSPGPAWFLLSLPRAEPVEVRLTLSKHD